MGYFYLDESRESEPHALPEAETFCDAVAVVSCDDCGDTEAPAESVTANPATRCPCCDRYADATQFGTDARWWFALLDGGLDCWASDPSGPYNSEAEAIAAARELYAD